MRIWTMNPQNIRFFLFFAVSCVFASTSALEGKIFVHNEGAYSAKFSVSYDLEGESKSHNSEELKYGENQYISIPSGAANVHLKVEKLGLKGFQSIFTKDFSNLPQKCYKLNGTLLSSEYEEISCLNVNMQNSQQVSKSHENTEIGGKILKIQKNATRNQIMIEETFKHDFPGAFTKRYNASGTGLSPKMEEVPKNATEDAGYITVENSSGFLITFSVTYDVNGKSESASSGDLSAGIKKTIPIPSEATNIRLDIKQYWFPGSVTTVFSRTFPTPVKKCYKFTAFGVIPCPAVDERLVRNFLVYGMK